MAGRDLFLVAEHTRAQTDARGGGHLRPRVHVPLHHRAGAGVHKHAIHKAVRCGERAAHPRECACGAGRGQHHEFEIEFFARAEINQRAAAGRGDGATRRRTRQTRCRVDVDLVIDRAKQGDRLPEVVALPCEFTAKHTHAAMALRQAFVRASRDARIGAAASDWRVLVANSVMHSACTRCGGYDCAVNETTSRAVHMSAPARER